MRNRWFSHSRRAISAADSLAAFFDVWLEYGVVPEAFDLVQGRVPTGGGNPGPGKPEDPPRRGLGVPNPFGAYPLRPELAESLLHLQTSIPSKAPVWPFSSP